MKKGNKRADKAKAPGKTSPMIFHLTRTNEYFNTFKGMSDIVKKRHGWALHLVKVIVVPPKV
jgi:hypothetical protein